MDFETKKDIMDEFDKSHETDGLKGMSTKKQPLRESQESNEIENVIQKQHQQN